MTCLPLFRRVHRHVIGLPQCQGINKNKHFCNNMHGSVTAAIFIDFCLKKLNVFSKHIGKKTNKHLNSAEQIPGNWNVDQLSVLITSWDITEWCSINLLWKELMKRMSEYTGIISSYQFLITAACTNTGSKMKGKHSRAADWCPFVPRHSLNQVTSFMQLGMLCLWSD